MNSSIIKIVVLAAFFLVLPFAAQANELFEYGPRPSQAVFDPNGLLDPKVVKKISDPLEKIFKDEHIDILVVVLPTIGDAPPEHVANQFAKAWCTLPIRCIVLDSPGNPASPWIFPSGKVIELLKPEHIAKTITDAQRRAGREPDEAGKVRAAATEAADMLRYWTNNVINRSELMLTERTKLSTQLEKKSRVLRMSLLLGIASLIPLTLGISMLVILHRKRGPRYFAHHAWRLRLGAPYAGGNHAIIKLGHPKL